MANQSSTDTTTVAPGVKRTEHGEFYLLEGQKAALIAAGVAEESWFASLDERDKCGRVRRSKSLTVDGRRIHTKSPAGGYCRVWVDYRENERDAKLAAYQERERERERRWRQRAGRNHKQPSSFYLPALVRMSKALTANPTTPLLSLENRLRGCAGLIESAADDIGAKHKQDPDEHPEKLADSSKLRRALDDLRGANASIVAVMKKLREVVGPEETA